MSAEGLETSPNVYQFDVYRLRSEDLFAFTSDHFHSWVQEAIELPGTHVTKLWVISDVLIDDNLRLRLTDDGKRVDHANVVRPAYLHQAMDDEATDFTIAAENGDTAAQVATILANERNLTRYQAGDFFSGNAHLPIRHARVRSTNPISIVTTGDVAELDKEYGLATTDLTCPVNMEQAPLKLGEIGNYPLRGNLHLSLTSSIPFAKESELVIVRSLFVLADRIYAGEQLPRMGK